MLIVRSTYYNNKFGYELVDGETNERLFFDQSRREMNRMKEKLEQQPSQGKEQST